MNDIVNYYHRIDAGQLRARTRRRRTTASSRRADIILVGVSRSGKTPTCLYMAMQFGIRAANYPLMPEDFSRMQLPFKRCAALRACGASRSPERLQQIATSGGQGANTPRSRTANRKCRKPRGLMRQEGIPSFLDATSKSVEELATTILHEAKLVRRRY